MKIGLNLPTWPRRDGSYASWPELRALALGMESIGVDTLWVPDHLQRVTPGRGTFGFWECWTILSAAAAVTSRIEVGPFIACTGFRNPALLAKMAATLDEVSGGRLVLGLGSGVPARDPSWSAFGFDGSRHVGRYAEAVEIVSTLVREGSLSFQGEHHHIDGVEIIPRGPRPEGIPILVAGLGERTLSVAARFGDMVNVNRAVTGPVDAAQVVALAAGACTAAGRDPATIAVTGWARLAIDEHGRAIEADGRIAGDPAEVAAIVRDIAATGITHLTLYPGASDDPSPLPALTDAMLDRFAPFLEAIRAG